MNLGHETQTWYDSHREIHEVMGVQVNPEMPKMWTPFVKQQRTSLCAQPHRR
jgi:hypothetical protein